MEILYPLIVVAIVVLGLYAAGVPQRIARIVGGPRREEKLLAAYTSLARAALAARHAVDELARRSSSSDDRVRLQQSVVRLQLALKPVLELASEETADPAGHASPITVPVDLALLQRLQGAGSEVQRALREASGRQGSEAERASVTTALHALEEAMIPLAVEPLARGVALAAEAFYQDCAREAAAQSDPLAGLQTQLVGSSYTLLYEAIQESSAQLYPGTRRPRQLS